MKKIITDSELTRFAEGTLSKSESKELIERLKDNRELSLLRLVRGAYIASQNSYAEELLGPDETIYIRDDKFAHFQNLMVNAAKKDE